MQVQNIECQIAQAQLRRYLTGEEMPNAIVNDLETHLKHCPDCMAAAQTLRESLKGVLASKITGKPLEQPQAPVQAAVEPIRRPSDLLDAPDSEFVSKAPKKGSNLKTLLYSGALAVVLILMSTVFKDPTALFGPRASSSSQDTPPETSTAATTDVDSTSTVEEPVQAPAQEPTSEQPTNPMVEAPDVTGVGSKPLETDGIIVADSDKGTTVVKASPPKQDPQPQPKSPPRKAAKKQAPGASTIKVYPPDSK